MIISGALATTASPALAARAGADPQTVSFVNLSAENSAVVFGMVGVLFGLIVTPWITVRPLRSGAVLIATLFPHSLLEPTRPTASQTGHPAGPGAVGTATDDAHG